jgi:hypothetical protein
MVRTQIQLPDDLYRSAKRIAERHEVSLAEVVRRGLEHMIRVYPVGDGAEGKWRLPESQHLGGFLAPPSAWRELSNEPPPPIRRRR